MTTPNEDANPEPMQPSETVTTEHGTLIWGTSISRDSVDRCWIKPKDEKPRPSRAGYSAT